jgi:hypothetical protein
MNSVTIVGFVGATRSSVKRGTTVQNSPFFPSRHNAPGKMQKTNGSRKSNGIASRYFALGWLRLFSTPSRKAPTCSSKAASSARPTSRRMAKGRRPRPRRSLRGRFAPMLCATSTAASQNRKHQRPVLTQPCCRPTRAIRLRSDPLPQKALRRCRRAFLLFCLSGAVRRFARSRSSVTELKGCWTGRCGDVSKTTSRKATEKSASTF